MTAQKKPVRRGPPNRMNDLNYKTWMKFQKSFFWYNSWQALVNECIHFFTKSTWDDGTISKSLIIGPDKFDRSHITQPRIVDIRYAVRWDDLIDQLNSLIPRSTYDFILVDLRTLLDDKESLKEFLENHARVFFGLMRQLLKKERYCGIVVNATDQVSGGSGFPIAWSVAAASRNYLKLRDEKVGLAEYSKSVIYCLFMQAEHDEFASNPIRPESIVLAESPYDIPAWIIPKSPPRKKNEILHPAKYPETLVESLIELFTRPGESVLDPMVGTGSTVIAAIRSGRNGYGVDLIQEFVDIANERVALEQRPMLFPEFETSARALIVQGDATHLHEIAALNGREFNYTITSPPYWSMLSNPGSENQRERRQKKLKLVYSDNEQDLGNVHDYREFVELLTRVYDQVADKLTVDGKLTIVVKNVKRHHVLYTLAWDIVSILCGRDGKYAYLGTTLWCQDDIGLKPFAVGTHWVSNTLHNYCLHLQRR